MISLRTIFSIFLTLNAVAFIVIIYHTKHIPTDESLSQSKLTSYKFDNPIMAFHILKKLDVFEPVNDSYFMVEKGPASRYDEKYLGLIRDDEYCDKARAYFVDHPDFYFNNRTLFCEYPKTSFTKSKVIPMNGEDVQYNVTHDLPNHIKNTRSIALKPHIHGFFTIYTLHTYQHLGKNFGCINQYYNHIPGQSALNRKDMVAESIVKYGETYADRPQCFSYNKFFPKTWSLRVKEQCRDFFDNYFNTAEYQRLKQEQVIVYIRKIGFGAHKAEGVEPVHEKEEREIRRFWGDGKLCGAVDRNYLIQKYIHNPLLLMKHKFDFRMYMLVASTNPLMVYYHDGFLRVSLHEYDVHSTDKGVLLTNTELSHHIFNQAAQGKQFNGMNETELRNFQMWNLTRLQNYLLENGIIHDPHWLDNYFRPEFKKAMIHLIRATSKYFLKRSSIYELFGVDFMLDENLNLWFLECNSSPVFKGTSDEKEVFLLKMLADHFEIVHGLLKSRLKRIIKFINKIIREDLIINPDSIEAQIMDFDGKQKEFKEISKNYFEPEFEPSPDNGFSLIIDENRDGVERYARLLPEECL